MSFKKRKVQFLPALKGQANRVSSDVIMKLKEKFEKVLKNSKPHFLKFDTNDCIEICDNFAIKFAEWLVIQYNEDIIYTEYNTKELLEIFKKSYKN